MTLAADTFQWHTFADAFRFIGHHGGFLWQKAVEHIGLSAAALAVAIALALPVGVMLGHLHRGSFLAISATNVGRALPTLAVIAILFPFLGVTFTNNMVALIVLAVPIVLTNAYVGVNEVDRATVQAARGMGMTNRQILARVELPLALPLIFSGIRTAAVFVVATATISGGFGGGGLGEILFNQASYGLDGVVGAAICVCLLAFGADFLFGLVQWAVTPQGLRRRRLRPARLWSRRPRPEFTASAGG